MKLTRQQAINAFCRECLVDDRSEGQGTWRQQVEACTAPKCPLFEYRPVSKPKGSGGGIQPAGLAKHRANQLKEKGL